MIPYDSIFVPLSAALGLSLTIERFLELAKNLFGRIIGSRKGKKIPTDAEFEKTVAELEEAYQRDKIAREIEKHAKEIEKRRQELIKKIAKEKDAAKYKALKNELEELENDGEWKEQFSPTTVLVEPATDPDNGTVMKTLILQLLGLSAGIIAAHYSGIQLFNSFLKVLNQSMIPHWLDFLLTGLLIGGGSTPMHILVRFVTEHKIVLAEEEISEKKEKSDQEPVATSPVVISPPPMKEDALWIDIPYYGGVDREKLDYLHIREKNPEMIIVHHTAMRSDCIFEDIVKVIKDHTDSKGNHWLTGYNCVVMSDGSIHPFCRWDRFGNHTSGYNSRSLGIALNGNFELNPTIPYSNADGKYGLTRPSEIQIKNTARVVVLWSFLYDIPIDFDKKIVPHKKISSKPCPGSGFPYDEFYRWVEFFHRKWQNSGEIQEKIEAFKLKPYLYV